MGGQSGPQKKVTLGGEVVPTETWDELVRVYDEYMRGQSPEKKEVER